MNIAPKYWMGNAESGDSLLAAISLLAEKQVSMATSAVSVSREEMGLPPLYRLQNGVGVVTISGPLVQGSAGYMALFGGVTGYDDIREAVLEAVTDPEASSILLHVQSGGGMVDGCEDLAAFITTARTYKPVVTMGEYMCSAAYWLGSNSDYIFTAQTSVLGSLGVIMQHVDRTEQLAQDGLKVTLIRAGKYKALGSSSEALTPEAQAIFQEQADTLYSVFINAVAKNRKVTYETADQVMGQGREFMGQAAVAAGLADRIGTYDQALAYARALDTKMLSGNNTLKPNGASAMKVTLENENKKAELSAENSVAVFAAELDSLKVENTALKASLESATNASILAQAKALNATAEVDALRTAQTNLVDIVRQATANMLLPLGGSPESVSQMSVTDLIAKHAEVSKTFESSFRAGGVALPPKEDPKVSLEQPWRSAMVSAGPQARKAALFNRK
jgi:signal peptide peptidase SppA